MKIAFYRYPKNKAWYLVVHHKLVCWWTRGAYSHAELVLSSKAGMHECASSSARDGGVRVKSMRLPVEKWELVEVDGDVAAARAWFER